MNTSSRQSGKSYGNLSLKTKTAFVKSAATKETMFITPNTSLT
jgi:hypothetical protein